MIKDLIKKKGMSLYRLSKNSGIPYTTINDIYHSRTNLKNCAAETVYRLARQLNVSMEELLEPYLSERIDFELFKSNVGHRLKELGDRDFILELLKKDDISKFYEKKWYPESLYLLAMLDYLSRMNDLPLCTNYEEFRGHKLEEILYPSSVLVMDLVGDSHQARDDAVAESIPEFLRHNIVEAEVRNVV